MVISWAAWYDHYRRNKPDYLDNLVERRKSELLENRKRSNPFYILETLPLCSKPSDPMEVQQFSMNLMTEGETDMEKGEKNLGTSKIALGLAYFPMQQIQMIMMQLSQSMPQDILLMIRERLNVARGRVQSQRVNEMISNQTKKQSESALEEAKKQAGTPVLIEKGEDEGPDDVDSIDGDSEERIIEVGDVDTSGQAKPTETKHEDAESVENLPVDSESEQDGPKIIELTDEEGEDITTNVEQKISEAIKDEKDSDMPETLEDLPQSQEDATKDDEETDVLAQEQDLKVDDKEEENTITISQQEQQEPEIEAQSSKSSSSSSSGHEILEPTLEQTEKIALTASEEAAGAGEGAVSSVKKVDPSLVEKSQGENLDLQDDDQLD